MAHGFKHGGVGGSTGGSELVIVGGTTRPSKPSQNMVWVNTGIDITEYALYATEPESPVEGMVWITIADSGDIKIVSPVRGDWITVYPISAKQYISGAWLDVEAKSYQNGTWVEWITKKYLFKSGEGALVGFSKGTSHACTISQTTTSVKITTTAVAGGEGLWITSDKHNLSKAKAVQIRAKCTPKSYTSDADWNGKFLVTSAKITDVASVPSAVAITTLTENSVETVYEIDVFNLDNSYYIGFWGQANVEIFDLCIIE